MTAYPFQPVATLKGRNVCSASEFTRTEIDALMKLALEMRDYIESGKTIDALRGRIMAPLFFENSSRTRSSFCTAMMRLGGNVVGFEADSSSIKKGESLQDTVRTLDSYSDVLVLRHPEVKALEDALTVATHPIMNAGNGSGEHPTQALLDTLTMYAELGHVEGITIALIGDLKMGRTVHSLLKLLCQNYDLRRVYLVAPMSLQMPSEVLSSVAEDLAQRDIQLRQVSSLDAAVVADCDVLYCTRLQRERFVVNGEKDDTDSLSAFMAAMEGIRVDRARLRDAKKKMIVMHPLPRVDELSTDVDNDPRCAYFRQMRYGLFMRMALLYSVLA